MRLDTSARHSRRVNKQRRHLLFAILGSIVVLVVWMLLPSHEPLFHGKPESYWITNIAYFGPDEQTAQWRAFGPDGIRLLTRTLDHSYGAPDTYRKLYQRYAYRLPAILTRQLPAPAEPRQTRMHILSLLNQMSADTNLAHLAEPSVARALKDEDDGVAGIALGWYESGAPLISAEARKARLPDFLRLAQDGDQWLRNNAAVALRHYREEAPTVTPVLLSILQETNPQIYLTIAGALAEVDPPAAVQAGVVPKVAEILKDPNDQIAYRAAELLGRLHAEPAVSVPALAAGTRSTNALVAIDSLQALIKFNEPMELILPALTNALSHSHGRMRRDASNALYTITTRPP